ncbi:origin recognition complex subunit 2 [Aaosphaeria arxii CBS 175.79]|uniref:Origin recognition complex subunit 2 n=1 Tax=Aaosphaeria arxii CBS 175.79 TaxID=1450172 RepID=A0A6A5XGZ2_9PLEO|nr:origin recognition complex subunit 2 [Aaosphaeria arxii CBS 175.79]KAF2012458.1 origin recognition complex subunit 2 [Aaosphaeria arxii CBS 175.79]
MVGTKRKHIDDDEEEHLTPKRLQAQPLQEDESADDVPEIHTPSRRGRNGPVAGNGTPRSILKKTNLFNGINGTTTPKSNRKLVFDTPTKSPDENISNGTPTIVRNADRSARRKSNRRLFERTLNGVDSDDEVLEEDEALAEQILSDDEEFEERTPHKEKAPEAQIPVPETPSKRGRGRPRKAVAKPSTTGRPRGRPRKIREPTPPEVTTLPAHEEYFWQNRPGGNQTSTNTLSSHSLLNHDEYFQAIQSVAENHKSERDFLLELHRRAFDQWIFELGEGFNICLYGYGSKRSLTESFTAHLYEHLAGKAPYKGTRKRPAITVINGYSPGITIKDILSIVASTAIPSSTKMPNQPTSLLQFILEHLTAHPPSHPIPIILNSIDSIHLRKSPTPMMLASLVSHPSINLVCTADTPNFPLLWDVGLSAQYNFLFHDATTFAPYESEIDVVESVNELLGRSGRRIGGRDGIGFVLRSLPENARSLFRILVTEQLGLMFMDGDADEDQDDVTATPRSKSNPARNSSESSQGVEYRVLYHKAVEDFVCSSEVGFRTLLKEFHDHQMVESRKDAMGTERLWVPFRQEELEALAEELSGDAF